MNEKEWQALVERIATDIYNGQQLEGDVSRDMIRLHGQELMNAIQEGYGLDINDPDINDAARTALYQLQTNVYHFSGAKNWQQLQEISRLLVRDGEVVPFKKFMDSVVAIDETYNRAYLKAEYNHAVASGQMASKWDQIQAEADALPYLQYDAVMDDRTREDHAKLEGIVLLASDPFWRKYYPPNGWNCRCTVRQLDEFDAEEHLGKPLPKLPEVPPMFQNNVGIGGVAFSDKHPYFKTMPEKVRSEVKTISEKEMPMKVAKQSVTKTTAIKDGDYTLKQVDKTTGAELWVHKKADKADLKYNISKSRIFIKNGISISIREHNINPGEKNPEVQIANKVGDFKQPKEHTLRSLQSQFYEANKQKCNFVVLDLGLHPFTSHEIKRVFRNTLVGRIYKRIESAYIITKSNKIIHITKQEVNDWSFMKKLDLL
jgi:SPP1 gp7 family putative phage head morphogenesis protein